MSKFFQRKINIELVNHGIKQNSGGNNNEWITVAVYHNNFGLSKSKTKTMIIDPWPRDIQVFQRQGVKFKIARSIFGH